MERVSRKICVELGPIASTCKAPRTGREAANGSWSLFNGTCPKATTTATAIERLHLRPLRPLLRASGVSAYLGHAPNSCIPERAAWTRLESVSRSSQVLSVSSAISVVPPRLSTAPEQGPVCRISA
jgi:hypothetical protein